VAEPLRRQGGVRAAGFSRRAVAVPMLFVVYAKNHDRKHLLAL